MIESKVQLNVFISTGEKNAFFTLRTERIFSSSNIFFAREAYIKNLSTNFEKAEVLAKAYYEDLKDRLSTDIVEVVYTGFDTDEVFKRRGRMSVRDTIAIERIEEGYVPFGKHKDKLITELPDSYLLWLTDKMKEIETDEKGVFFAFASVASGIAHDRGLIAKRDAERAERERQDLLSNHFGELKKRYTEEVEVVYAHHEEFISKYKILIGNDILFHNGNVRLEKGPAKITFTVKFHNVTQNGIKKTYINRIKLE